MKNIKVLRNELAKVFEQLKKGDLQPKVAKEMNNAAGKMIATVKMQLEYASLRKENPDIDFLNNCK